MDYYKILGVDKNATMREVKEAYENKVKNFREEIKDEIRVKKFIDIFDKAYEEIKLERENIHKQKTMLMNINEIDLNNYQNSDFYKEENDYIFKRYQLYKEEEKFIITKNKRRLNSKELSTKKENNDKSKSVKSKNKENKKSIKGPNKIIINKNKKESSVIGKIIKLILKVLVFPIIIILSMILFLCKILNLISWIASKIIIIGAIAGASIHGYQVYIGHAVQYRIFILCAIGFIASLFLPYILKVILKVLEGINNRLKRFTFKL